jgi:hypothetical protein
MGWLLTVYDILMRPTVGIKRIKEEKGILFTLFIIGLSALSVTVAQHLLFPSHLPFAFINLAIGLIFMGILFILGLFGGASILHFVAEGLKGEGKATTLFFVLSGSLLPWIFAAPSALIIRAVDQMFLKIIIFLGFNALFTFWVIVLQILGLKENYGFSTMRAFIVYITPGIVAFVVFSIFVTLFLLSLLFAFIMIS